MLHLLADEDFNGRITRGLFLRKSDLDLARVQDVGLQGADDEVILEWTQDHECILLTHDARTMPGHVRDRLADGLHFPGRKRGQASLLAFGVSVLERMASSEERVARKKVFQCFGAGSGERVAECRQMGNR